MGRAPDNLGEMPLLVELFRDWTATPRIQTVCLSWSTSGTSGSYISPILSEYLWQLPRICKPHPMAVSMVHSLVLHPTILHQLVFLYKCSQRIILSWILSLILIHSSIQPPWLMRDRQLNPSHHLQYTRRSSSSNSPNVSMTTSTTHKLFTFFFS